MFCNVLVLVKYIYLYLQKDEIMPSTDSCVEGEGLLKSEI